MSGYNPALLCMRLPDVAGTKFPTGGNGDDSDMGSSNTQADSVFADTTTPTIVNGKVGFISHVVVCNGGTGVAFRIEDHAGNLRFSTEGGGVEPNYVRLNMRVDNGFRASNLVGAGAGLILIFYSVGA